MVHELDDDPQAGQELGKSRSTGDTAAGKQAPAENAPAVVDRGHVSPVDEGQLVTQRALGSGANLRSAAALSCVSHFLVSAVVGEVDGTFHARFQFGHLSTETQDGASDLAILGR